MVSKKISSSCLLSNGEEFQLVLMFFCLLQQSIFGLKKLYWWDRLKDILINAVKIK
ncbi:hypothetical protein RintRC_7468 [Richelia intracellularis]|nr:hypothetical protein RintRC_7468 [Richelia intracellularis]